MIALTRRLTLLMPALAASPAIADTAWPSRPVRMIVPFAPGGPSDGIGRILAEALAPKLGQPVVVENRPGGGSVTGTTVAAQANDAHTLLVASGAHVVNRALHPNLPFDPLRDFQPIGLISTTPLVVTVPASSPLHGLEDLIAAAKANPGRITYGSAGTATINTLAAELFKMQTGTDLTGVNYRGEGALLPDLAAGTVNVGFLNLLAPLPLIQDGRLRALAVTASSGVPQLPGVRSMRDQGVPGFDQVGGWWSLLGRGLPEQVLPRLDALLRETLAEPRTRERMLQLGMFPAPMPRAELARFLESEAARWAEVVRRANIRAE